MPPRPPQKPKTAFPPTPEFYGQAGRNSPYAQEARDYMRDVIEYNTKVARGRRVATADPQDPRFSEGAEYERQARALGLGDQIRHDYPRPQAPIAAPPRIPPVIPSAIPQFYGQEAGPRVSEPATNWSDWAQQYQNSVSPTKPLFDTLMEIAEDPRNAWIGLGPMAGMVKGARLIKPLVAAEQSFHTAARPAKQKTLLRSGSEQAAKILDYDPILGHTTNPVWGSPRDIAEAFQHGGGGPPPTPDEIVAAQHILKTLAQQNAPETITLYRGGEPIRHAATVSSKGIPNPNTPIPVTSSLNTATEFTQGRGKEVSPLFELQVPREDLLANIEKLQRSRGYRESEYLIPLRSFEGAQLRLPFPNPPLLRTNTETYFPGAKFMPRTAEYVFPQMPLYKR